MVFPALVAAGVLLAGAPERSREEPAPIVDAPHVEGEVLVAFRDGAGELERTGLRTRLGARKVGRLGRSIERIELAPGLTAEQAIARHAHDPAIRFIEPNYLVHADELPDDPRFPEQYGLHNAGQTGGRAGADIDVEPVWRTSTGSHDVLVAVLDTGIDLEHPDLAANIWTNPGEVPDNGVDDDANGYVDDMHGWDFRNDDNNPKDDNGHGTHTAGIVGAVGDNGIGISGVSWKVRLVGLKFLGSNGVGTTADAIAAVDYAARIGARVTNNSWGGAPFSQALYESIQAATAAGVLFVASAGNDGRDTDLAYYYPAGYEDAGIVSVAMADQDGVLHSASNYGASSVDLAAPGVAVLSTVPGGLYRLLTGTSMAAPHVAGAAALLLSIAPDLEPADLRRLLVECALPDPALARLTLAGGRLNVRRMLEARDTVAPGAIADLQVETVTSDAVLLRWTAPGDDGQAGVARRYELRRSEPPGLVTTVPVAGLPRPGPPGSLESFEAGGLEPDRTYRFSLVAVDEWSNPGAPSNVVSVTTASPPGFDSTPRSFELSLFEGQSTERALTLRNLGAGPLDWRVVRPVVPSSPDVPYPLADDAWLAVDRPAGRLGADAAEAIRLSIDAGRLDSGVYESSVDVATNDPGRPLVEHGVRLLVQGAPVIVVDPPQLELGQTFLGTSTPLTLTIRNRGSEALHVTDVALAEVDAAAVLAIEPRALTVPPQAAAPVRVVFTPAAAGTIEATLVVESDAPNAPRVAVPLAAQAAPPPAIAIDPLELHEVTDGAPVHRTLSITNPGQSPLEIALSFQDPSKAPAPQILVNGGFETGDFSGWKATSNGRPDLTPWMVAPAGTGFFLDSNPYEGRFDALNGFDGDAGLEYDLVQTFVLPADAVRAELSYRDRIQFDGTGRLAPAPRLYRTTIEDAAGAVLLEVVLEQVRTHLTPFTDRGWRERRADLAPFAGRTLRLHVHQRVPETDRGPALLELDDFRIDVAAFPDWVRAEPHRATIPPGESLPIEVVFDPRGRSDASLSGTLRIDTNVPGTPTLRVGLALGVGGEPDIAVQGPVVHAESTLEFGDRFASTHHTLEVLDAPAAGGSLVVQAEGDFTQWSEFASVLLEGQALGTLGRSGFTCSTVTKVFPLDAALLARVTADGVVEVEVRNHPDASPYCPRNRHRVALEYRPAAGPIDFGAAPPGSSTLRTIAVVNRGTRPLSVRSIATDAAPFEVAAPGELEVPPFGEKPVELSFRPESPGAFSGRVTIESDDPDTPHIELALEGRSGAAAALTVQPERLDATLDAGTSAARSLTLSNPGGAPLEFALALEGEDAAAPMFERLGDSPTPLTCVVADREHGTIYGQTLEGTSFFRYDAGEAGWVLLAAAPIDSGAGCGAALLAGKIYTAYVEDSRLGVYDIARGTWTTMPAPIGHTANIATDGAVSLYQLRNERLAVVDLDSLEVRALAAPPFTYDPSGALRYLDGKLYAHQGHAGLGKVGFASYDVAANAWTVLPALPIFAMLAGEIDPRHRTYLTYGSEWLVRYSIDSGAWLTLDNPYFSSVTGGIGALDDPAALYFVEGQGGRGFARMLEAPPLAALASRRGTIPPGASVEVEVDLSAVDRGPGIHAAGIVLDSNDASAPQRTIPIVVQVEGVPDIALHGEARSVSSTRDYETSEAATHHRLRIEGPLDGPARLALGVTGDFGGRDETALARVNGTALGLVGQAGGVCQTLSTVFLVDGLAPHLADGALELDIANDPAVASYCPVNRHEVRLTWGADVRRLDFGRVVHGAVANAAFTIENRGGAVLHVGSIASDDPRFTAEPEALELAPGTSARVAVAFRPAEVGAVAGTLAIESDDPDLPRLTLPLAGQGIGTPRLAASPNALTLQLAHGEVAWQKLTLSNGGAGPLEVAVSVEPAGFVGLDPTTLLLAAGSAAEVTVRIDARGLAAGAHPAEIRLASNDPAAPLLAVPVALEVLGAPRLAIHGDPVIVDSEQRFIRFEDRTSHALPIERPPAGGAVLELTVEGDFHGAIERTATAIAEGRRIGVVAGAVFDCEVEMGTFALSPAELDALVDDALVEVEVQNSQYVDPRICPVNRHAVRLRYDSVLERLDFGARFAGFGGERSIVLENTGSGPLSISSIVTEGAAFGAAASSLELAPGASASLEIDFHPGAPGPYAGLLRLESDDPAARRVEIPLAGTAVPAPRIAVEPPELVLALARGEAATHELSIANGGPGSLDVTLGVVPASATFVTLDPALAAATLGPGQSIVAAVRIDATGFPPSRREAAIEIASSDPASPRVVVPIELTVTGAPILRLGGSTVTVTSERSFSGAGAATTHRLALPAPPGGAGILELATEGDFGAGDETASVATEGLELGSSRAAGQDCRESVTSFNVGAAPLALLAEDGAVEVEVRNARSVGSFCPANSHALSLRYPARVDALDFGEVWSGTARRLEMVVENGGTDLLRVTSIETTRSDVVVAPATIDLQPGARTTVGVTFTPASEGALDAELRVTSNDPGSPVRVVPLVGAAARPPALDLDASPLEVVVESGAEQVLPLHVGNTGGAPLAFDVTVPPASAQWLSVEPASGAIAAGSTLSIAVRIDARQLAAGSYAAALALTSNDPARQLVAVPVALDCRGTPRLEPGDTGGLDFGTVLVGRSRTIDLTLRNRGGAVLHVASVAADDPAFTPSPEALAIAPGATSTLRVAFAPLAAVAHSSTLAITSDDPAAPLVEIGLGGIGADPPRLERVPHALDASLPSGGRATTSLVLTNTGPSPLDYTIDVTQVPSAPLPAHALEVYFDFVRESPAAPDRSPAAGPPRPLTCIVGDAAAGVLYAQERPGRRFLRFDAVTGVWNELATAPLDSGNGGGAALLEGRIYTSYAAQSEIGVYDIATDAWTTIQAPLASTSNIASDGSDSLFLVRANLGRRLDPQTGDVALVPAPPFGFSQSGGLREAGGLLYGHAGGASASFGSYDPTGGGWTPLAASPGPALLGAAIDAPSRRYVGLGSDHELYRYALDDGTWDELPLPWPTSAASGLTWLADPVTAIYLPEAQGREMGRVVSRPSFLVVERHDGSVPPGGAVELPIGFDAARLAAGSFAGAIVLTTNDLARPVTVVPVTLSVSDAPHLSLLGGTTRHASRVDLESGQAATLHALSTPASPAGRATLRTTVTDGFGAADRHATVAIEGSPVGLVGGTGDGCVSIQSEHVIGAAELAAFTRDGTVEIEVRNGDTAPMPCPDGSHTVELSYRARLERVDFGDVVVGAAREIEITLENDGTLPLALEALESDRPELTVGAWPRALAPGESATLRLVLAPLGTGAIEGTLAIASNDPGTPRLELPWSGTGRAAPSLALDPPAIEAAVGEGGSTLASLAIANSGSGELSLELGAVPAFVHPSATRLDLAPGAATSVELVLDAADLAPGAHTTTLVLSTNDPARSRVELPLRLEVTGAPNLMIAGAAGIVESAQSFGGAGAATAHALAIPAAARAARLELEVEGDFGLSDETATLSAEGHELGVVGGLGPDCATGTLELRLDAPLVRQLAADGVLALDVRNAPRVDAQCTFNRHRLRLLHHAPLAALELGEVLLGDTAERQLELLNIGSHPLEVASVGASAPGIVVQHAGPTVIAPGDRLTVPVTFTPPDLLPFEALLTVTSDDPDAPVVTLPVSGQGVEPPRIEVDPRELEVVLSDGDDALERLILRNSGARALEFTITEEPLAPPFLTYEPHSGLVPPGGALGVTLRFDSDALPPGNVEVLLAVATNDPLERIVRVPVRVRRLGRPDIALRGPRVEVRSSISYALDAAGTTHTLPIGVPPAGAGRLDLVADGDYGGLGGTTETATVSVGGRVLGSVGNAGIDCIPVPGSYTLDPTEMDRHAAAGALEVVVQNSQDVGSFCARNRHTLVLSYDAPLSRIDLGSVFVGGARAATMAVRNEGHGSLHVASVACDDPRVEILASAFVVPQGATFDVPLVFAPGDTAPLEATLEVVSDDLDEPVSRIHLAGHVLAPPAIAAIEPSEIGATLPQGPPVVERRTLRLRNTGASGLAWSAQPLDLAEPGYRSRDSDAPDGAPFVWRDARAGGVALELAGDDEVSPAQPLGFDFPFFGGRFGAVHVSSDGWLSFTDPRPSSSNPETLPSANPSVPANLVAPFWDDLHARGQNRVHARGDATSFVVQWSGMDRFAGGAELTFQAILYPSGVIAFQYLSMSGRTDSATIGIQNGARDAGVLVARGEGYVHDGLRVELTPSASWIDVDPAGGTLDPGETETVAVELTAVALERGRHTSHIVVSTNDPAQGVLDVPVTLDVDHVPLERFVLDAASVHPASRGRAVRARLQLPPAYDPSAIDVGSVRLSGVLAPLGGSPPEIADTDGDGVPELLLEFDRAALLRLLPPGQHVPVFVSGRLADEQWFAGSTEIGVPRRLKRLPDRRASR